MDPTSTDQQRLDFLLGVANAAASTAASAEPAGMPGVSLSPSLSALQPAPASAPPAASASITGPRVPSVEADALRLGLPDDDDNDNDDDNDDDDESSPPAFTTATTSASAPASAPASASATALLSHNGSNSPKKRPLDDKKARDRKRVLRNRQLARVSNERRKGRIKAMEHELTETRQTVSTLEESIRCLEEENRELRNLLNGKPESAAHQAAPLGVPQPGAPVNGAPGALPPPSS